MQTQIKSKMPATGLLPMMGPAKNLWKKLIQPHPTIQKKDEQRRVQLLATMLLIVISIGGALLAFTALAWPNVRDDLDFQLYVTAVFILLGAYGLSRTTRYQAGALILIAAIFGIFVFVPFLENAQEHLLAYAVLAPLLTGFFFPLRWVVVISVLEIAAITFQIEVMSPEDSFSYILMLQFAILADMTIVTFIHHLSSIERERRKELEAINEQLRASEALLERRVHERTRDLTVASDVSRRTTTVLDLDTLLPQLTRLTVAGFDLYAVSVFLYDDETGTLRLEAGTDASGRARKASHVQFPMSSRDGLISQAARERQAVVVNDVWQSEAYLADPDLPDTRSEMALPMLVGEHLVGVLDLQSQTANRFSNEDQHILTTLAEQVAIAVRNAQLFEETKAARQAAEEANETKSRFLANMSHELRTPLNAILNFTAFVADGVLGPINGEQEDVLQEALASGKHLLSLINDVLDITKIEAGMMDLFVEELDFNAVLTSAVSVGKGLVKDKPVKLVAEIDDGLPNSFGDKRRLRQVFLNLISNAAKFTSEGQISITAHRYDDGVEVIVSDTGIGIAPDEHHKVFESFKQAKHDLSGAVGTGLGMPISRYFVEIHSGRIWFESEPGKGTTFYVRLPSLSQDEAESINDLVTVGSAA